MNILFESFLGMKLGDLPICDIFPTLNGAIRTRIIEDRYYMEFHLAGIDFDAGLDQRIRSIHFHSAGHHGYSRFLGELPEAVSFEDTRITLLNRLGKPSASGGGKVIAFYGKANIWDRYDRLRYSLHIQYGDEDRAVNLVTLMRLDVVPK